MYICSMKRSIERIHSAPRHDIGNLMTRQVLPVQGFDLDPFLLLNHHGPQEFEANNSGLPFGPHPHRGFETLTFILDGELVHRDNTGESHRSEKGGVQWMTAGKGIIHAEESSDAFRKTGGTVDILQLWMNLPSKLKMTEPAYRGLHFDEIVSIQASDHSATLHLISGEYHGNTGPINSMTGLFTSWLTFEPGQELELTVPEEREVLFYAASGHLEVNGEEVSAFERVHFSGSGEVISAKALDASTVIFAHGEPLREPVASYGPFVMNTQDEIRQAIDDYQSGKFSGIPLG